MGKELRREYEFVLAAHGLSVMEEVPIEAIGKFADDCLVSSSGGVVRFDFFREGRSLAEVLGHAMLDLRQAGVSAFIEQIRAPMDVADEGFRSI